jgi:hypothetical protein
MATPRARVNNWPSPLVGTEVVSWISTVPTYLFSWYLYMLALDTIYVTAHVPKLVVSVSQVKSRW